MGRRWKWTLVNSVSQLRWKLRRVCARIMNPQFPHSAGTLRSRTGNCSAEMIQHLRFASSCLRRISAPSPGTCLEPISVC